MNHAPRSTRRAAKVAATGLLAALTLAPLTGPISPAGAVPDNTVEIDILGSIAADVGESTRIFANAEITAGDNLTGLTVQITDGFDAAVDNLDATPGTGITATYDNEAGILRLSGIASADMYSMTLRSIIYTQAGDGTPGTRTFMIVKSEALYLEETGNLYEFVTGDSAITWSDARTAANDRTIGDYTGHLVNITSQAENDGVMDGVDRDAWIGATDEAVEGEWRWTSGPESGELIWTGDENGEAPAGVYTNWETGQPDDWEVEDYSHIESDNGQWNDTSANSDISGYLVEYEIADISDVSETLELTIKPEPEPEPEPEACRPELEARHTVTAEATALSQLYTAYFNRTPDDDGFAYWRNLAAQGMTHEEISGYFAESTEFEQTYGDPADDEFTTLVYNNVLCRDPDGTGSSYWMTLLGNNAISRSDLMLYFSQSIEFDGITKG